MLVAKPKEPNNAFIFPKSHCKTILFVAFNSKTSIGAIDNTTLNKRPAFSIICIPTHDWWMCLEASVSVKNMQGIHDPNKAENY